MLQMPLDFARYIDHAALHPAMSDAELRQQCQVAVNFNTASICIKPYAVKFAAGIVKNTPVKVCAVVGFPHGSQSTSIKIAETKEAIAAGAAEIDFVINIGKANSADWSYTSDEISRLCALCRQHGALSKVIFENSYLSDKSFIAQLCKISSLAGADFVKTSTGFDFCKASTGQFFTIGALEADVRIMKQNIGPEMQVKASGGIKSLQDIERLWQAGATRFGTSSAASILST
jgi:deoxyribose-phosphate aldolase